MKNGEAPEVKKKKPWKFILLCVVVGLVGLVVYRGLGSTTKKAERRVARAEIPIQIIPAASNPLVYSLKATGDIAPLMQVDLFPKVSGYLEKIQVSLGDTVRQGQVVAQIDRAEFLHKVKETEAKLAQAKAQLSEYEAGSRPEELRQAEESVRQAQSRFENAKLQRERVDALFKRQVISKKELDTAEMEYTVAEAQLAASQQNLKIVSQGVRQEVREGSQAKLKEMEALLAQERIHYENTLITAPFPGEIVRKYVDAGALLSPSTPVVQIMYITTVKVVANVMEKDVALLKPGMKARIQVESYPDRVFEGKVEKINSALDLSTRTLQTEIYIPNTGRLLKPGMYARIEVALVEKPKALQIPREAVLERDNKRLVFVAEGNQALARPVRLGYEQDRMVEVLEGLKEGDRVVIKGQQLIKEGSTVRIIEGS